LTVAARRPHPAEERDADVRARSVSFSAHVYLGAGRKLAAGPFPTLREAADAARALERRARAGGNARGALVLGETADGQGVHFPRALWPQG
jgi:hypothetical protein